MCSMPWRCRMACSGGSLQHSVADIRIIGVVSHHFRPTFETGWKAGVIPFCINTLLHQLVTHHVRQKHCQYPRCGPMPSLPFPNQPSRMLQHRLLHASPSPATAVDDPSQPCTQPAPHWSRQTSPIPTPSTARERWSLIVAGAPQQQSSSRVTSPTDQGCQPHNVCARQGAAFIDSLYELLR